MTAARTPTTPQSACVDLGHYVGFGTPEETLTTYRRELAQRVTRRRQELSLSTEELARAAGVDALSLAFLERGSDSTLSKGAVLRLALALGTTQGALDAGLNDQSMEGGQPGDPLVLESLTTAQCKEHLAAGGSGRIVLSTSGGTTAIAVNFIFVNGAFIFGADEALANRIKGIVAFEVDQFDHVTNGHWSVLARGHARPIGETPGLLSISRPDGKSPASGAPLSLIAINPFELIGRLVRPPNAPVASGAIS